MSRNAIRGALNGFLGTYTSQYSRHDGYWLFGFLVESLTELEINLLTTYNQPALQQPLANAHSLANRKFLEQLNSHGVMADRIATATLTLTRLPGSAKGFVNRKAATGCNLSFSAIVTTAAGKNYRANTVIFVAPHNPLMESKSAIRS